MSEEDLRRRLEHLEAEVRALRAFEAAPYRSVVEDMTELVVRWKPDGARVFVNDAYCRLFATPREQLVGTSFWPLISDADREWVNERIRQLSPERPVSTGRHRAVRPNGEALWMEWTDRALFDDQWNVVEYQSVGRDITERVNTDERLRRLEQADAVARASSTIAHDLKNVLSVMSACLELIRREPTEQDLGLLQSGIEQGSALLRQLKQLRYGKVLMPARLDLNHQISQLWAVLEEVAAGHIRIVSQPATEPCEILGDATQIDQILLNLVRNAAEASSGEATVILATDQVPGDALQHGHHWLGSPPALCAVLRVTDDAGGIRASVLPRLFEPYITTKPGGDGLGLSTAKLIVDAHGGSIAVTTTAQGTAFEIAFPAATDD